MLWCAACACSFMFQVLNHFNTLFSGHDHFQHKHPHHHHSTTGALLPPPFLQPTLCLVSTAPGTIQVASCCYDSPSWILEGACGGWDLRASSFQWALQWFVKKQVCPKNAVCQCQHKSVLESTLSSSACIAHLGPSAYNFSKSKCVTRATLLVPKISIHMLCTRYIGKIDLGVSHLVCIQCILHAHRCTLSCVQRGLADKSSPKNVQNSV